MQLNKELFDAIQKEIHYLQSELHLVKHYGKKGETAATIAKYKKFLMGTTPIEEIVSLYRHHVLYSAFWLSSSVGRIHKVFVKNRGYHE